MSTIPKVEQKIAACPEERSSYRAWYAEFDAAREDQKLETRATYRTWYAEFDGTMWDQQLEKDVAAGRLDWLIAEARKDHQDDRCSDR